MLINARHYTAYVLLIAFGLFVLKVGALVLLDPLQIFHKPWVRDSYYIPEMRMQAAGIINNVPFDSVIMGTSMAQNFSPQEASSVWGRTFVNLSMSGSLLSERSLVLDYIFRKRPLRTVIISLDGFAAPGEFQPDYPPENFSYLYNATPLDDVRVYLNDKYSGYLLCGNRLFADNAFPCNTTKTLETVTEWASNPELQKRFGGFSHWLATSNQADVRFALEMVQKSVACIRSGCERPSDGVRKATRRYEQAPASFDLYLLKWVVDHPDTEFYVFFPPYSRLRYAMWRQEDPGVFALYTNSIRYIVDRAEDYKNLRVFGFDDLAFPDDIANYQDLGHFHPRFSSLMLQWMQAGDHELNNAGVDAYINTITRLADSYDLLAVGEAIAQAGVVH
jgi:hypothetical protein